MKRLLITNIMIITLSLNVNAQLEGDVTDNAGKYLADVVIIATDSATKKSDTVRSDERGYYSFRNLVPGHYKIEVKATGFLPKITYVKVNPYPPGSNESDDTYFAETFDIILERSKTMK